MTLIMPTCHRCKQPLRARTYFNGTWFEPHLRAELVCDNARCRLCDWLVRVWEAIKGA